MYLIKLLKNKFKLLLVVLFSGFLKNIKENRSYLPILCYHSVNEEWNQECDPISPSLFEQHLIYIKENFNVLSLSDLSEELPSFNGRPSLIITFDDGYRDNAEVAFELLKKYDLKATIFIATGFIDKEVNLGLEPMSWDQILYLDSSNLIEIGCHTRTHRILSEIKKNEVIEEITNSKERLEDKLQRKVTLFAYPNGQGYDIPIEAVETVKSLGFSLACSTFWRSLNYEENRYMLNRIMIQGTDSVEILSNKLNGSYDFLYFVHKVKSFIISFFFNKGIWEYDDQKNYGKR